MDLIELVRNDTVKFVIDVAGFLGFLFVVIQFSINVLRKVGKGARLSKEHFEKVIELSSSDDRYLSACILILLTRILTSLFLVLVSTAFLAITLFFNLRQTSAGQSAGGGLGLTGSTMDYITILFFALSCTLLIGNVVSATNFSRAVRRSVDKSSVKAPFARALIGFKD